MKSFLLGVALFSSSLYATTWMTVPSASRITLQGASTLHDFTIKVKEFDVRGKFTLKGENLKEISNLTFTAKASSLDGGDEGMNEDMYEALKVHKHPQIRFQFESLEGMTKEEVTVKGHLSVAGTSRLIELKGKVLKTSKEQLVIQGKHTLLMTSFDVEPPSTMLGLINTEDNITVEYKITLTPKS